MTTQAALPISSSLPLTTHTFSHVHAVLDCWTVRLGQPQRSQHILAIEGELAQA